MKGKTMKRALAVIAFALTFGAYVANVAIESMQSAVAAHAQQVQA